MFFPACFIRFTCYSSFRQILLLRCLLLIVTVCYISFPLNFIVTVVLVEDFYSHSSLFCTYNAAV